MKVVIAGASGLIGTALQDSLRADGHTVVALVRRPARGDKESTWDPARGVIDTAVIASADVVINLAGASIGDKRLTKSYQQVVRSSRTDTTGLIARTIVEHQPQATFIQASAMGYYGDKGEEHFGERSEPGDTLLADIVEEWEGAAKVAVDAGVHTIFLRTGLVLAPHGGFARRLLPLVKRGLLRRMGHGRTWHSWITLHDHVRAVTFLIGSTHLGPVNVIAPLPARNERLIWALTEAAGRRPMFAVPAWVLRIVEGPAVEDLFTSQLGQPGVLKRLGFTWDHPDITTAALWVLGKDSR